MELYNTSVKQDLTDKNRFKVKKQRITPVEQRPLSDRKLPHLVASPDATEAYWYAWERAFNNIHHPTEKNGFIESYIDTAFNECIFMWDSAFMTLFGKYASQEFNFLKTLDVFYATQHDDGYICRQIRSEDGEEAFEKHNPSSTGPNILAWVELKSFSVTNDVKRLTEVFPVILSYHRWLKKHRTWKDGAYWSNGWACGMDNTPRQRDNTLSNDAHFDHGFLSWADITVQQYISAMTLEEIASIIGSEEPIEDLKEERKDLRHIIMEQMWCEETFFLFDVDKRGNKTDVKSIGAFWLLHTDLLNEYQVNKLVAHLMPGGDFDSSHPVPSLSVKDRSFAEDGNYWCGGVWAPTNYMVFDGLCKNGFHDIAHTLAVRHLDAVIEVFKETNTLWENYAPIGSSPGTPSKPKFVGWTGLSAISMLIEYVLGIRINEQTKTITWQVRLLSEHGLKSITLGDGSRASLLCKARKSLDEKAQVEFTCDGDYTLVLI